MMTFDATAAAELEKKGIEIQHEVSGRKLTTFGSGGFVDYLILPVNTEQLAECYRFLENYEYHLLGAGSNSLISDNGLKVVLCTKRCKGATIQDDILWAASGESLPALCRLTTEMGLGGLEFACGIPATVGGAVAMNAGAFGTEIRDILISVEFYKNGKIEEISSQELGMSYRSGRLMGRRVISAKFKLKRQSTEELRKRVKEYLSYRDATQPHEPSAGSVFKRINGQSPAVYIQGCGLKGARIGYATVSGKHCNFVVNSAGAATRDFLRLTDHIKDKVRERYGIELETEVILMRDTERDN